MKKISSIATCLMALSLLFISMYGCSTDNPVSTDNGNTNTEVSANVQDASSSSVQIYRNLSSFSQISQLIQGPDAIADLEVPEVKDPRTAMNFARSIKQKSFSLARKHVSLDLQIASFDSVIWDVTERNEQEGVTYRTSLIYNAETGTARLFVVGFDYPSSHPLEYDSTEIKADLNFTILDDTDDVLISLENLKRYKPDQLISEERGSFIPDDHAPGTEPMGGVLMSEIKYTDSSFIRRTEAELAYHEGQGASYRKTTEFSDNTTHVEEATFNEDGTGTFKEIRRDGSSIEGSFDSAEDDGQGSFSLTTTFPAGHDPVSVTESGEFTITDAKITGTFRRETTRLNGDVETENVEVTETKVGDVKVTTLSVENSAGSKGFLTITETPEVEQVKGEWTNEDETFVVFTAESYPDNSAHLEGKVYENKAAFENGAQPTATFDFDFYPDGSGQGVVTENGKTYDVTINPDGSVTIKERV